MAAIDYGRLDRVLARCEEIAGEPGAHAIVARVYKDVLKPAAKGFREAHAEIASKESAQKKEAREAREALEALDRPYRSARATVLAYLPHKKLPETLKAQPTDPDKLIAIEALLDVIDEQAGQGWADELAAAEFGKLAPKTIKELNEAVAADKELASAREARASAFAPAYEKYLAYKRVVRETLGNKSKQYKRIHVRVSVSPPEPEEESNEASEPSELTERAGGA
jgi:hypothetical protein